MSAWSKEARSHPDRMLSRLNNWNLHGLRTDNRHKNAILVCELWFGCCMTYSPWLEHFGTALRASIGCMPLRHEHLLHEQLDQGYWKPSSLYPDQLLEVFKFLDLSAYLFWHHAAVCPFQVLWPCLPCIWQQVLSHNATPV